MKNVFDSMSEVFTFEREMTQEELEADLKATFDRYDADGSGDIDRDEVEMILIEQLGVEWATKRAVDQVFKVMDTQGKGEIGFKEFVVWYLRSVG